MDYAESENNKKLCRLKCKSCGQFLSVPFNYHINKEEDEICLERYKAIGINYHDSEKYCKENNFCFSEIYCSKCSVKIGYWITKGNINMIRDINHLYFNLDFVDIMTFNIYDFDKEELDKFKQGDKFYSSNELNDEVFNYAKNHIDNFINNFNVLKEKRIIEEKRCNNLYDKLSIIKNLFINNIKNQTNPELLGIDFSEEPNKINNKEQNLSNNEKKEEKSENNENLEINYNNENVIKEKEDIKEEKEKNINKSDSTSDIYNNKKPSKPNKGRKTTNNRPNKRKNTAKSKSREKKEKAKK